MTELLSPAGDFTSAKVALYNGCDAIYCAAERFGARAYAKNLTMDELKELLILAHSLNKKIYVTVNTIIKEDELDDCISFVKELYKIGVDGLILADYALINYVIDNCSGMEAHISTQAGVKNLDDIKFFEELGARRCVVARENTIDEIKYFKANSNMPLEVFAHGALCVSYSGGCLMSSLLTLRSGNRGRCSQNCRREYTLYKNGKPVDKKAFFLSMRDLNTSSNLKELINLGVDSIKLEGRMKSPEYVKIVTSEYRKKIDDNKYNTPLLETVFHRNYTKGFLFGEDRGSIVDISKRSNEGELIGIIKNKKDKLTEIELSKTLNVKDRIRIENNGLDYYFTIDTIYNKNKKEVQSSIGISYLNIFKDMKPNSKIYKMIDSTIDISIDNKYKKGITIEIFGKENSNLTITTVIDGKKFSGKSEQLLQEAKSRPIDDDTLFKQLAKLNDTSFYLKEINNHLVGDLFITVSGINEARRNLINNINSFMQHSRELNEINTKIEKINYDKDDLTITAFCVNDEQYNALKDSGIENIYYKNYAPYVGELKDINNDSILVGNYGGIYKFSGKELTSDYSFNVINSKAIYDLHKAGIKYVTPSLEASYKDLCNMVDGYKNQYGNNPNLEIIVYGKQNLMTLKYCPLRRYGECGKCNQNKYEISDDIAKFGIYHDGCITHIVNEKPLNLIDDLDNIFKLTSRIRLQFTTESYDDVIRIVNEFKDKIKNPNKSYFNKETDTRGYFKREIL